MCFLFCGPMPFRFFVEGPNAERLHIVIKKEGTLIKKKIQFSSFIRKFRVEQLQSHIRGRASEYRRKCANISPYMRRPFCQSFMTLQLLHSEFPYILGKFYFRFYQCKILFLSRFTDLSLPARTLLSVNGRLLGYETIMTLILGF